jgi:hypothetical protein
MSTGLSKSRQASANLDRFSNTDRFRNINKFIKILADLLISVAPFHVLSEVPRDF